MCLALGVGDVVSYAEAPARADGRFALVRCGAVAWGGQRRGRWAAFGPEERASANGRTGLTVLVLGPGCAHRLEVLALFGGGDGMGWPSQAVLSGWS